MLVSTVLISPESIVKIAKNTTNKPLKCEWMVGGSPCTVILACWELLKKHQLLHCGVQKKKATTIWTCSLPRCNIRNHSSLKALQIHVEQAHLSRTPFPCPFKDCSSPTFTRPERLVDHFQNEHAKMIGRTVRFPSELFLPSWRPFFPPSLPPPPPLPKNTNTFLQPITINAARTRPGMQRIGSFPVSPRKRSKLHEDVEQEQGSVSMTFEPLETYEESLALRYHDILIQPLPKERQAEVSRPPPMLAPLPAKEPAISIHYAVFAERVDQMERDKVITIS